MTDKHRFLTLTKRIQALAQAGITYTENPYDMERYHELRDISVDLMHLITHEKIEVIRDLFANQTGYQTPMVDIRAVVFKDEKILLVKELIDGCWSLPGGWGDVGYTPGEVAAKEVKEEAGIEVKPVRILAVMDKKCHDHPPQPFYVYKLFILCKIVQGNIQSGIETLDVGFFARNDIPHLSVDRNIPSQIDLMFEYLQNPEKPVYFD
ncbi:NUDIX hydrolase [Fulvivirgaceae bacterium BMA12]|uniref:NUDIX hydrolase n=1 Tax=Agaribacillus aureus TaxID=3051825 RepID=A0ABT8LEZ4_9BACT|nr:NUDIX hydrolase [Fulvivirgaceae bacterium BMA12]